MRDELTSFLCSSEERCLLKSVTLRAVKLHDPQRNDEAELRRTQLVVSGDLASRVCQSHSAVWQRRDILGGVNVRARTRL